jgi:hypothetical protein
VHKGLVVLDFGKFSNKIFNANGKPAGSGELAAGLNRGHRSERRDLSSTKPRQQLQGLPGVLVQRCPQRGLPGALMFRHPKYYQELKKKRLQLEREQANERASEQANKRASEQANKLDSEQASDQASDRSASKQR